MEVTIFEGTEPIGRMQVEERGLFWNFFCKIEKSTERIRRIFVLSSLDAQYLGIPDASGILTASIAKRHLPNGVGGAAATAFPRGEWSPWRGALDGVEIETAFLRHGAAGIELALPPEESVKFPAWVRDFQTEKVHDTELAVLRLDESGHLPLRKRESRGNEHEENDIDPADSGLSADAFAGDCFREQGWEADCADV